MIIISYPPFTQGYAPRKQMNSFFSTFTFTTITPLPDRGVISLFPAKNCFLLQTAFQSPWLKAIRVNR